MKGKVKSILKLRELEDRMVNLTSGWIATELKNYLETNDDSKTIIELSEEAHKDKLKTEGLTDALIFDMVSTFSNLRRFHNYQVTLDTFYKDEASYKQDGFS